MESALVTGSEASPSVASGPIDYVPAHLLVDEDAYRAALEHVPFGTCEQDLQGRYLAVNSKLCEITGFGREELLAMSCEAILHPEDRAASFATTVVLLRWRHSELGLVAPDQFIAIAEATGLIVPIGEWVLATACAQARSWQEAGLPRLRMAVNISARQFRHKSLLAMIRRVLENTGLDAGLLEVEITESMAMQDPEETLRLLGGLKESGTRISLDDFGTGFSSLSYLKRFPIDVLKIDQSFVRGIAVDRHDAAIARTVIDLARSLKLRTIAEGVETAAQGELLRAWTCDDAQGYHFSLPLPAGDATAMLQAHRCFPVQQH